MGNILWSTKSLSRAPSSRIACAWRMQCSVMASFPHPFAADSSAVGSVIPIWRLSASRSRSRLVAASWMMFPTTGILRLMVSSFWRTLSDLRP